VGLWRFAHELADAAGERLLSWFGKASAGTKGDGSVVTDADLEVDRLIHQAVAEAWPEHGVLSEEISQLYAGASYTWVVDPLDGTTNFANGLAHWGSSIALLHQHEPLLAVIDFPLLQQRFSAVRGQGAWLDGRLLTVPPHAALHGNQLFTTDSRAFRFLEVRLPVKARILGAAAYDMSAVAAGVAVACMETTPKVWDLAAAWLLAEEAGVAAGTLFDGPPVFPLIPGQDYGRRVYPLLLAASPELWQQFRANVHLRPGTERLAQRYTEQGWVLPGHLGVSNHAERVYQ
jgi:myo-inositol-1(or 4)-monophosphatase